MDTTAHWYSVEWYDEITGQWGDMGEARNEDAARARIAGLRAADGETPRRYRIVETRVIEILS